MNSIGFGDLVMLVIVGGIIYMIYSTYKNNRDRYPFNSRIFSLMVYCILQVKNVKLGWCTAEKYS